MPNNVLSRIKLDFGNAKVRAFKTNHQNLNVKKWDT